MCAIDNDPTWNAVSEDDFAIWLQCCWTRKKDIIKKRFMNFLCSLADTELCGIQICQRGQQNGFIYNILRGDYVFVFMEEKASRERKTNALISTNCTLKMWCTYRDKRCMGYEECCRIISSYFIWFAFCMHETAIWNVL